MLGPCLAQELLPAQHFARIALEMAANFIPLGQPDLIKILHQGHRQVSAGSNSLTQVLHVEPALGISQSQFVRALRQLQEVARLYKVFLADQMPFCHAGKALQSTIHLVFT